MRSRQVLRSLICLCFLCLILFAWLFQPSTLKGGPIGDYIDKRLLRYNIRKEQKQRQNELLDSGVMLPELDIRNNRFKKEIPEPFSLLSESLNRTLHNKRRVWEAENLAELWKKQRHKQQQQQQQQQAQESCQSIQQIKLHAPKFDSKDEISTRTQENSIMNIPNWILQPNEGEWFRPIRFGSTATTTTNPAIEATIVTFDDSDMMRLIRDQFPDLLELYDSCPTKASKVYLWTLCALYWYGGYAFGSTVRDVDFLIEEIAKIENGRRPCDDFSVVMYDDGKVDQKDEEPRMLMMASSPRNPHLLCLLRQIARVKSTRGFSDILTNLLGDDIGDASAVGKAQLSVLSGSWGVRTNSCQNSVDDNCCAGTLQRIKINDENDASEAGVGSSHLFIKSMSDTTSGKSIAMMSQSLPRRPVEVAIAETTSVQVAATKSTKKSIHDKLKAQGCLPGWLCNRCLRTMLFGSFAACSYVCNSCYQNIQCAKEPENPTSSFANIGVTLREKRSRRVDENLIPSIIHQTWMEDVDSLRFPELVRLQNSWRQQSEFEFRFYNDTEARHYVATNYPERFLEAYDSFLPGAFKADFFRLLVLYKDGGIYADADVHLEINLATFLTPNLSFFVPRETIRDLAGKDYCLWNGLLGAAPGHPIIAKAIERMLELISTKADYYDVERRTCIASGNSASVWKLRSLPTLLLSGPCALGMAVNEAIGKEDLLANFEPGWLAPLPESVTRGREIGDALILLADKKDMGSFRFSDVDRNFIVASTDMIGLSKKPVFDVPLTNQVRSRHYSETEFASDIYGSDGVYNDRLVIDESLKLDLTYVIND